MIGTLTAPTAIVAGLYQQDGPLRMVGRSASLTRAQYDAAQDHGVWRHSLRVIRIRVDLTVDDLPAIGEHVDSA